MTEPSGIPSAPSSPAPHALRKSSQWPPFRRRPLKKTSIPTPLLGDGARGDYATRVIGLRDFAELLRLGEALKLLEALVLDLPDPLAGDIEGAADLVQGPRV